MNRRSFLASPVLAAPTLMGLAPAVFAARERGPVIATGDGIPHTPQEYSELLKKLSGGITPDSYSREGVVATLEARFRICLNGSHVLTKVGRIHFCRLHPAPRRFSLTGSGGPYVLYNPTKRATIGPSVAVPAWVEKQIGSDFDLLVG
jgi:hypothetical protein